MRIALHSFGCRATAAVLLWCIVCSYCTTVEHEGRSLPLFACPGMRLLASDGGGEAPFYPSRSQGGLESLIEHTIFACNHHPAV